MERPLKAVHQVLGFGPRVLTEVLTCNGFMLVDNDVVENVHFCVVIRSEGYDVVLVERVIARNKALPLLLRATTPSPAAEPHRLVTNVMTSGVAAASNAASLAAPRLRHPATTDLGHAGQAIGTTFWTLLLFRIFGSPVAGSSTGSSE